MYYEHTSHWEGFGNTGSTKIVKYGTFTGKKVKFGPFLGGKVVKFHKNTKKMVKYGIFTGKKVNLSLAVCVAQWVEHQIRSIEVQGSSPRLGKFIFIKFMFVFLFYSSNLKNVFKNLKMSPKTWNFDPKFENLYKNLKNVSKICCLYVVSILSLRHLYVVSM